MLHCPEYNNYFRPFCKNNQLMALMEEKHCNFTQNCGVSTDRKFTCFNDV